MDNDFVKKKIQEALPGARVEVTDQGGGDHLAVTVISAAFAGKSRMQQHQMIYGLFKDEMASEAIHALSLKTATPDEVRS